MFFFGKIKANHALLLKIIAIEVGPSCRWFPFFSDQTRKKIKVESRKEVKRKLTQTL
jgi:hypothetical protein